MNALSTMMDHKSVFWSMLFPHHLHRLKIIAFRQRRTQTIWVFLRTVHEVVTVVYARRFHDLDAILDRPGTFCLDLMFSIFLVSIFLHPNILPSSCAWSARSGVLWVRKCGKLLIRENLVMTWPYTDRLPDRSSAPQAYQCKITPSIGMANQM